MPFPTISYLLRHAESAPSKTISEPEWPLSQLGRRQATHLVEYLTPLGIDHIFSSPYKRALNSVAPFAAQQNYDIEVVMDLRERKLSEGYLDNFSAVMTAAWENLNFAMDNCESGRAAQERIVNAMTKVVLLHPGKSILVSSHGNAIGLYLNSLDPSFGFTNLKSMRTPDLFRIQHTADGSHWDREFSFNFQWGKRR